MRILVVARWPVGGIRTYLKYIYKLLESQGVEATFLLPDIDEARLLAKDVQWTSCRFIFLASKFSALSYSVEIFRAAKSGRYDVIHIQGLTALGLSLPSILAGVCKSVVTLHDVFLEKNYVGFAGGLNRFFIGVLLGFPDVVQCVSDDALENLNEFVAARARSRINAIAIRNGIDTKSFESSQVASIRNDLALPENAFLIGFFGRFMAQKGLRFLLSALSSGGANLNLGRPWFLVTVGKGGYFREEMETIRELGIESHFINLDAQQHLGSLIKAMDLVCIPSVWEACPLLPMECMVCGVPLITSDCIGLREVVNDTPATVVDVCDAKGFMKAIGAVASNEEFKESASRYRGEAVHRFAIENSVTQLHRVFQYLK